MKDSRGRSPHAVHNRLVLALSAVPSELRRVKEGLLSNSHLEVSCGGFRTSQLGLGLLGSVDTAAASSHQPGRITGNELRMVWSRTRISFSALVGQCFLLRENSLFFVLF